MADPTVDNLVPKPIEASVNYLGGGMNYVGLLRRLKQECGVTGSPPSTVENLSGEMGRLAAYINEAWLEIQNRHRDWMFLKQPISFLTGVGVQKYSTAQMQISSFSNYDLSDFTISSVDNDDDESPLFYMPYEDFKGVFMRGAGRTTTGRPANFSLNGQKDMLLGAIPDKQYRVRGEGWVMPTELVRDTDRPSMPGQHHLCIVHKAMMLYGSYEAAPEVYSRGEISFNRSFAVLAADQLPEIEFGAPLA